MVSALWHLNPSAQRSSEVVLYSVLTLYHPSLVPSQWHLGC